MIVTQPPTVALDMLLAAERLAIVTVGTLAIHDCADDPDACAPFCVRDTDGEILGTGYSAAEAAADALAQCRRWSESR